MAYRIDQAQTPALVPATVPVSTAIPARAPAPRVSRRAVPVERTAVIADASTMLRRIVANVLSTRGWKVTSVADGVELMQAVLREQPDLVVTDVELPRLSGWVVTRMLKQDWSTADIPVLLLTSLSTAGDRYRGEQVGSDSYLTKDFEPADLAATVKNLMTERPRAEHRPDPIEVGADAILERACELLDRSLFTTALAAEVSALPLLTSGLEATVAALLELVSRVTDNHLAGIVLANERTIYLQVGQEVSAGHAESFIGRAAADVELPIEDLDVKIVDRQNLFGRDEDAELTAFQSLPLHGYAGKLIGVLALSSAQDDVLDERALATLEVIAGPAALVLDAARLDAARRDAARRDAARLDAARLDAARLDAARLAEQSQDAPVD